MEEGVDVKTLTARFDNKTGTADISSRDSGPPKAPRPVFGRAILPVTENHLSPAVPPPPRKMVGSGLIRSPSAEPVAASIASGPVSLPRPPPSPGVRPRNRPAVTSKVKQTGEMLQSMLLRQQRPPSIRLTVTPAAFGLARDTTAAPTSIPLKFQQRPRQRSTGAVTPLRRPLPPEGPRPLKPDRPPNVNLGPFLRYSRSSSLPGPGKQDASPGSAGRRISLPAVISPPRRSNKPSWLPRQAVDVEDNQESYDDIAGLDTSESWRDKFLDGVDEDLYESIDETVCSEGSPSHAPVLSVAGPLGFLSKASWNN